MGRPFTRNCAFPLGNLGPHPSPQPKRHLDRFSRFAGLTSVTDIQTDHATRFVSLGTEVGLGPGGIVLDGDPALPFRGGPQFWRREYISVT